MEDHVRDPNSSAQFIGMEIEFWNKDEGLYHRPQTRVFLVQEMPDGKWLYWGNAIVTSQTIESGQTKGKYRITKIYRPDFQKRMTIEESPSGKSFFDEAPESYLGN